jgi:hypothetical protein
MVTERLLSTLEAYRTIKCGIDGPSKLTHVKTRQTYVPEVIVLNLGRNTG